MKLEISLKIITSVTVESLSLGWCIPQALLSHSDKGRDNLFLSQRYNKCESEKSPKKKCMVVGLIQCFYNLIGKKAGKKF